MSLKTSMRSPVKSSPRVSAVIATGLLFECAGSSIFVGYYEKSLGLGTVVGCFLL